MKTHIFKTFRLIALLFILFHLSSDVHATHIIGGDLSYKHISGDQYEITLTLRRDCNLGQVDFDNPASIGLYSATTNVFFREIRIPFVESDTVGNILIADCGFQGSVVCVQTTTYKTIQTLPVIPGGYIIAYQRCCRNGSLNNVINPLESGSTEWVEISERALMQGNSSPTFKNWPDVYICANKPLVFDHSASESDGDSLVYKICTPFDGGTIQFPQPQPPSNPPYNVIQWRNPYTLSDMMGGTPLVINPKTGVITANPNLVGQFLIGVCVEEYRNGVLMATVRRDFQYNVRVCNEPLVADFDAVVNNPCDSLSYVFTNKTNNASSFEWNFNFPSKEAKYISTLENPLFRFEKAGIYTVRLLVRSSQGACDATILKEIEVRSGGDFPSLNLTSSALNLCPGVKANLLLMTDSINKYQWSPLEGLDLSNPTNPIFTGGKSADYNVTVTNANNCSSTGTISIVVKPATPILTIIGNRNVCDSVNLNVSGGNGIFEWSNTSSFNGIISNTSSLKVLISGSSAKYFVRSVGADCGDVTDSVTVINQTIQLTYPENAVICKGTEKEILINKLNLSHNLTYTSADPHIVSINGNIITVQSLDSDSSTFILNVRVTNQYNCSQDISIAFEIISPVKISGDKDICNDIVSLQATGGNGNFEWSNTREFTNIISTKALLETTLKNVSETFYVRHTSPECKEFIDSVTVTNQSINITFPANAILCSGSTKDLIITNNTAAHSLTYTSSDPHIVSINGNTITVQSLEGDGTSFTLGLTITNQYNCSKNISIAFEIISPVKISGDKDICNDIVSLQATGGNGYFEWSNTREFTNIISTKALLETTLKNVSETFYVRHTSPECKEFIDSVTVTNQSINITFPANAILCSGSTKDLIITNNTAAHSLTYTSSDPHIVSINGNTITVQSLEGDGTSFTLGLTITNQYNCSKNISIAFEIISPVKISGDKDICNDIVSLQATGGNGNFEWSNTREFTNIISTKALLETTLKNVSETFYVRHTSPECKEFIDSVTVTNQSINITYPTTGNICKDGTKDITITNNVSDHALVYTSSDPHVVSILNNVVKIETLPSDGATFTVNLQVLNQYNCRKDISIVLQVISPVKISGSNDICDEKVKLTVTGGAGGYQWSNTSDFIQIIGQTNVLEVNLTLLTQTFFVRSTGSACTKNLDSIKVTNQSIRVNVPDGGNICKGSTKEVTIANLVPGHNLNFIWNDPHVVSSDGNTLQVKTLENDTTTFEVKGSVTNQYNCTKPISILFRIKDQKPVTFKAELLSCNDFTMCFKTDGTYEGKILWNFGSGLEIDTSTQATPCFKYNNSGKYQVTLTNLNAECPFIKESAEITVPEIGDSIVTVSIKQDICQNSDVCFSITGKYFGNLKWDFGNPASTSNSATSPDPCHTFTAAGSYIVSLKSENTVCPFKEVKTNITVTPKFVVNPLANQTVCEGKDATLNASSNDSLATYSWFDATGKLLGTGKSLTVNPMTAMDITLIGLNNKGCKDSTKVMISTFKFNYTVDLPKVYCPKTDYQIKLVIANPENYTYVWTPTDIIVNGGTTNQPIFMAATGKTIKVVITNKATGCSETREITPVIEAPLIYSFSGTLCNDQSSTLNLNITNSSNYTYVWSPTTAIVSGGTTNSPVVKVTQGQVLKVLVTNKTTGCAEELSYTAQVLPQVTVTFTEPNIEIKQGASTDISVKNPLTGGTYTWSTGEKGTSIKVTPFNTTTYTVTVSDTNGCTGSGQITVNVRVIPCSDKDEYLPNAFTPNGDGKNDILYVKSNAITELEYVIFNRWGQEMFSTNNINEGWDGRYQGREMSPDVYAYYIKGTCLNGDKFIKKGNVSLLR